MILSKILHALVLQLNFHLPPKVHGVCSAVTTDGSQFVLPLGVFLGCRHLDSTPEVLLKSFANGLTFGKGYQLVSFPFTLLFFPQSFPHWLVQTCPDLIKIAHQTVVYSAFSDVVVDKVIDMLYLRVVPWKVTSWLVLCEQAIPVVLSKLRGCLLHCAFGLSGSNGLRPCSSVRVLVSIGSQYMLFK